jgi:hypothetical protein
MPRTTIDIDSAILAELDQRKREEGKTLGQLVSELLAVALRQAPRTVTLSWAAQPMSALVDLDDKEAVRRALDGS